MLPAWLGIHARWVPLTLTTTPPLGFAMPVRAVPAEVPFTLKREIVLLPSFSSQTCVPTTIIPFGVDRLLPEYGPTPAAVPSGLNTEMVLLPELGTHTWLPTTVGSYGAERPLPERVFRSVP